MSVLHQAYRPMQWDEVFGQDAAVAALQSAVEHRSSQCFLLSGPSGCGKTTLARIAAWELGCDEAGLMEIDAATYTSIEQMRQVQNAVQFQPLGDSAVRVTIIDEAHGLSKQAMDSLLKVTEEPPENVFWFFCTTNPDKLPKTLLTRCLRLHLREIEPSLLTDLVSGVAEAEGIQLAPEVRQIIVSSADGSARQALVNLATCRDARDRRDAADRLQAMADESEAGELYRLLARGDGSWEQAMGLLGAMNGANPESIRIGAANYFAGAARKAKEDAEAVRFLTLLKSFSQRYDGGDAGAQLIHSIGQCFYKLV